MSKELEALEKLVCTFKPYLDENKYIKEDFAIIETALKENAELKSMIRQFNKAIGEPQIIPPAIDKKLKALEIIRSKIVNIKFKYGGKMGNVIELQIGCDTCYLHFDENDKNFDLLKEVLLCLL